jgi:acyl-CoA thioesterase-1
MPRAFSTLLSIMLFALGTLTAAGAEKSILVLGDSLSAAYGIAQARGWVALLEERLKREQLDYSVVNASVSGDTTSGGLARLDSALKKHQPRIVVVELGGNDGLRGLPVQQMRANLGRIIEQSQQAGARVVLVGMKMPPNYGPDYTQAFESVYGELAKRYKTALVPFLLQDLDEAQFQPDRIHPTAEAQPLMLERVWKVLRPLLK